MKLTEILLALFCVLFFVLDLMFIPGMFMAKMLSFLLLAQFYYFLGFAFFNGIRLKDILKKESYTGKRNRIIGAIATGYSLSLAILGILFKTSLWAAGSIMIIIALLFFVVILTIGFIKNSRRKSDYYTAIFTRIIIIGILSVIVYIIPLQRWVKIKYRNYPSYIEIREKLMEDPQNDELYFLEREEWNRIMESR